MPENLGDRLRYLRGSMSRVAFAELFGVSQSSIVRWENGERTPDTNFLSIVAEKCNTTLDWLLIGKGSPPPHAQPSWSLKTADIGTELHQKKQQPAEIPTRQISGTADAGSSTDEVYVSLPLSQVQNLTQLSVSQVERLDAIVQDRQRLRDEKKELQTQLKELIDEIENKDAIIDQHGETIRRLMAELELLKQKGGNNVR